ncbi:MAG: Xaa-Pro peptidase family protein [Pirellulaceae bacterium]
MTHFAKRRTKLLRAVKRAGADAILVTNVANVTYLTGFTGDDSYLLVGDGLEVMLSDPRYSQQINEESPGLDMALRDPGTTLVSVAEKVIQKARVKSLAVEAESMTVARHAQLSQALPKTQLVASTGLVEALREIKDAAEIQKIREAVRLAEKAFGVIRAGWCPGQTERWIAHELEHRIRGMGGEGCSFPPIVAGGARAALPHAVPTGDPTEVNQILLIDWGATAGLYRSDLTRMLVTGKISPKFERIYRVVLEAQERAIAAIEPGALMSDVDRVARSSIAEAGYGKRFGHGLGHGFGLEVHESPRLAATANRPLKAGMVVTVEPGIYLPNWGGIRIEDDVLVTRDGHEVLSSLPKDLASCVVT